jgi:hypothetical protein
MPSILNIALNLFKNNSAIKTLAAKRASRIQSGGAINRFAEAGKARKLSKEDQKRADDLESIADKRFGTSRGKGVSLTRLLASIDRVRRKNALRDKVTVTSIKKGKNGNTLMSRTLTYDKSGSKVKIRPHKHVVKQIPVPGERTDIPISKAKRISFWCDCEDFNFRWEYALATRWGASTITNEGADQFPVATNPGLALGCCKHGFVLLTLIKQRGL